MCFVFKPIVLFSKCLLSKKGSLSLTAKKEQNYSKRAFKKTKYLTHRGARLLLFLFTLEQNKNLKIQNFVLKCPVYSILNIKSYLHPSLMPDIKEEVQATQAS